MKQTLFLLLFSSCLISAGAAPAQAVDGQTLKLKGDLRYQYQSEHNLDLGTSGDSGNHTHAVDGRMRAEWTPRSDLTFVAEGRGYRNFSDTLSAQDEETGVSNSDAFFELRQLWARADQPFGALNWNIQLGRQRLSESYNFWWNRDLDLVRVNFDYTLLKGFVAVGQDTVLYRTGPQDFDATDEERLRLFGEISHQWTADQFIEGRFLHENDHSGLENIGTVVNTHTRDDEDAHLTWVGLRAHGQISPLHYRADLIGAAGTVDGLTTTSGPGVDQRTVTAHTETDVRAYAFDAEGVLETTLPGNPSFLLGYAFGSGDDNASDGTDHAFRQSGLQGNSSRAATMDHLRYQYGDVLNPDLSNLHVFSLGTVIPTFKASETSLTYRYYRLVDSAAGLRGDQIDAALDGTHTDLGQGLDLTMNIRLGEEFPAATPLTNTSVRVTGGAFRAGEAYVTAAEGEIALRGFLEFRLTF